MKICNAVLFSVVLLMTASEAKAQSVRSLQADLAALREDVQVLQRESYREKSGDTMAPRSSAEMARKMGEFDQLLRDVIGKTDELDHKIKKINERLDIMNKDIDVRFKMLEGKPLAAGAAALTATGTTAEKFKAPVASGAPKSITGDSIRGGDLKPLKNQDVQAIYQQGLDALQANNNALAEQNFELILSKFADHKLAGNAQYWLGESYYGKKDYQRAAVAFAKGYQNFKNSPKGADSLLKLGMSMQLLNKKTEACAAFTSLEKEFPDAEDSVKNKAKSQAKTAGCK